MKPIYSLVPKDPIIRDYVFFEKPTGQRNELSLRKRYFDIRCTTCGKFDEYQAMDRGFDELKLKSGKDFSSTFDACFIVSLRFVETCRNHDFGGLLCVPLSTAGMFVLRPTLVVDTNIELSKMQLLGTPCAKCDRYPETCFWPSVESLDVPNCEDMFFSPSRRHERKDVASTDVRVSEKILSVLQSAKLTGIDWAATKRTFY